jgi:hypothetical protein
MTDLLEPTLVPPTTPSQKLKFPSPNPSPKSNSTSPSVASPLSRLSSNPPSPPSPLTPAYSISGSPSSYPVSPKLPLHLSIPRSTTKTHTITKPCLRLIITGFKQGLPCLQCRILNLPCSFRTDICFEDSVPRAPARRKCQEKLDAMVLSCQTVSESFTTSEIAKTHNSVQVYPSRSSTEVFQNPPPRCASCFVDCSTNKNPRASNQSGIQTPPESCSNDAYAVSLLPFQELDPSTANDTYFPKSISTAKSHPLYPTGCRRCARNGEICCILESQERVLKNRKWIHKRIFRLPGFEEVIEGLGTEEDVSVGAGCRRRVDSKLHFKAKLIMQGWIETDEMKWKRKNKGDGDRVGGGSQNISLFGKTEETEEPTEGVDEKELVLERVKRRVEELIIADIMKTGGIGYCQR